MTRILVVDDEAEYRIHLRERLSAQGFKVSVAKDGIAALRQGWAIAPDLLIVDQVLRGPLDGPSVARAMRKRDVTLPTILMTGNAAPLSSHEPWNAIVEKPFRFREMMRAIQQSLSRQEWPAA